MPLAGSTNIEVEDPEARAAFDDDTRTACRRGARLFQYLALALLPILIFRDSQRFPAVFGELLAIRLAYVPVAIAGLALLATAWAERRARGVSLLLVVPWVLSGVLLTVRTDVGWSHFAMTLSALLMYALLIPVEPRWVVGVAATSLLAFLGGVAFAGVSPGEGLSDDLTLFGFVSIVALGTAVPRHRLRWQAFQTQWGAQQAQAALAASEARFRMVTQSAPVLLWLVDRTAALVFVNDVCLDFSGRTREQLLGERWADMLQPDDRAAFLTAWHEAFEARRRFSMEARYRRADGEYRWLLATCVPRFDVDGSFAGYSGSCVDMTEQRRANEDRERFFTLSLDLLSIADFDGRTRCANPAWERTLGYPMAEQLARPFLEFVHPDDRNATLEVVRGLRAGTDVVAFENRYRHRDGSYRWMSWRATAFPGDALIYAAARDVTQEKASAAALAEARDRAVEAARLKSEFLANMSHEIRTPMNGVIGMTQLALETDLTGEQREYLEVVRRSADALLTLIDDILDLSKIEAGRAELYPEAFDPRDQLAEVLKPLAVRAAERGLALRSEVAADVPATIVADRGRVRQILVNLVGNAIKFTATGEVAVRVDVGKERDDLLELRVTVRDTGIGVEREQQRAIFDAFVQADGSTTRRFGGTGLGLAISRQLVALMGGRIWLDSTPGAGSTFGFAVPLRPGVAIAVPPAPVTLVRPRASGVRVLVAEDNATNRLLSVRMLEKHGHTVETVETGRAAIGAVAARPFDVVLMDVQMPDIDGLEATATIRAREGNVATRLPIVAITAHAMPGDRQRCLDAGMDAYLAKPVASTELLATIDRLVHGGVPSGPIA